MPSSASWGWRIRHGCRTHSPEAVEVEKDDRCRVKDQQLADQQPADHRKPKWAAQFCTLAEADRERQRTDIAAIIVMPELCAQS